MKARLSPAKETTKVPGPGNYEVHLKNKKAAPNFGFGSSTRGDMAAKTLGPGPGAYRINSKVADVPGYAIPNRPDAQKYV
jgi:hypothetical protein